MSLNILLVDDSVVVRAVLKRALDLAGAPVGTLHEASDGRQALDVLMREQVDLVFTDLMMPNMSGEQLLAAMHEQGLSERIPVIVISSAGGTSRQQEMIHNGARAFLRKPFTPEEVLALVQQVVEVKLS